MKTSNIVLYSSFALAIAGFSSPSHASWFHHKQHKATETVETASSEQKSSYDNYVKHHKYAKIKARKTVNGYNRNKNCFLHLHMFCKDRHATYTDSGLVGGD